MKKNLFIILVVINQAVFAQPAIKLYAYSQETFAGMVPQRDIPSENGEPTARKPISSVDHYIYLATNTGTKLTPLKVFIKGKWYDLKNFDVVKTPVERQMPQKRILVAATKMNVIQLQKGDPSTIRKPAAFLQKMMQRSELILSYSWKGLIYYIPLKKITVLDPIYAP